ncbi:hypothetical protein BP5796_00587 [Coleophoma crateriformis]|uniref:CRAL-TRIO domain-containing protein n=1 Tax=Coleophoma crateriformis TaxID=565419 RepID=A0A3D8T8H6_9HELO|nr:hypothetical protein BP5796_00587 [Coleophoma crateriformis]
MDKNLTVLSFAIATAFARSFVYIHLLWKKFPVPLTSTFGTSPSIPLRIVNKMATAAENLATVEQKMGEVALEEPREDVQNTEAPGNPSPSSSQSSQPSPVAASLRAKTSKPHKTPIVDPLPSITLPTPRELTDAQQAKYDALLQTVKGWKEVPSASKGGPITEDETMWLSRECLLRYLRATKWNTTEAATRLLGTLTWRREYGVETFTPEHISPEGETGKQVVLGFDIAGRPCQYLSPGRQNTDVSPRQVHHMVYMLERAVDLMLPTQETVALLINFTPSKNRSNTAPGIGQGREVLNILQTHYPERLGRALVINIPWVVWGFLKLISPFIDPETKAKLKFNEDVRPHVPPQQLWAEFQGDLEFEYDHATYWPALTSLCEEKRKEKRERWVRAGKNIGESEAYMKGGDVPSLFPDSASSKTAVSSVTAPAEISEKSEVDVSLQPSAIQAN